MADAVARDLRLPAAHQRVTMQKFVRRKSTIGDHRRYDLLLYGIMGEFSLRARLHDLSRPAHPAGGHRHHPDQG